RSGGPPPPGDAPRRAPRRAGTGRRGLARPPERHAAAPRGRPRRGRRSGTRDRRRAWLPSGCTGDPARAIVKPGPAAVYDPPRMTDLGGAFPPPSPLPQGPPPGAPRSADGRFWWDGTQWLALERPVAAPSPPAGPWEPATPPGGYGAPSAQPWSPPPGGYVDPSGYPAPFPGGDSAPWPLPAPAGAGRSRARWI